LLFEALAFVTSITSALGTVFLAKGMRNATASVAALYSVAVQAMILTSIIILRWPAFDLIAVGFFALSGLLALGIGRLLNLVAMKQIGVAKTSTLIGSNPVLTTLLSILILSERPDLSTIAGATTVALGIVLINGAKGFKIEKALLIGLSSAFSYSLSNIAGKAGLNLQPDPFLSSQIGATTGFLFFVVYLTVTSQLGKLKIGRISLIYFSATGVISSVGWLAMMKALELGSVSVVTTIVYSYPLFSILFTRLMIREEVLSRRTVIGSVLIVLGVVIVTLL